MSPTAAQILDQALKLDENERRELALDLLDSVLGASDESAAEVLKQGLAATHKAAFDRELMENYAAGERGEYISEEESIARVEAIERGE